MKLITTVVRPERLPEVKTALFRAGITGITLSRVSGHGGEHEIVSQYRGRERLCRRASTAGRLPDLRQAWGAALAAEPDCSRRALSWAS